MPHHSRRRPDWRTLPPPDPALRVSVIMPVRNEARRLPAALRALANQRDGDGALLPRAFFEVIVLANNCDDASADIVRRVAARHPGLALHVVDVHFPAAVAHVGHARACLMDEACRRLQRTAGMAGVIASTDGDSRVAPGWLAATMAEVRAGADAVGGRIVNGDDIVLPRGLLGIARRDALYQKLRVRLEHAVDPDDADPWPRHHQHFGASLAITVAAYRHVGGLPAEPFLEDEALYRQLRWHDLKVRHSERVSVVTSSRRRGRVAVGLSWQLRAWQSCHEAGDQPRVDHPLDWAERLALRQRLRMLWARREARLEAGATALAASEHRALGALASRLRVATRTLEREWQRTATFGAFWASVEVRLDRRPRRSIRGSVAMSDAIVALRRLIERHERRPAAQKRRAGTSLHASQ